MRLMEEAARLMGAGGAPLPEEARTILASALDQARALPFHSLVRPCALSFSGGKVYVDGVAAPGHDLAEHLAGCQEGVLVGGTLGAGGDMLLKRLALQGATWAAAAQAALSAHLESQLDQLCLGLQSPRPGCHLTSRFSPGYGDLPLTFQPFLMDRLQMARLGVRLTGGLMMAPAKTVTAIAGWRPGAPHAQGKCAACDNLACPYRKTNRREDRP